MVQWLQSKVRRRSWFQSIGKKSSFVCTFEIEGPFKLIQTSTNSPQKYELGMKTEIAKTFNLVTDSHVELLVKFDGYQPNDPVNWPLTYKVYHHGSINIFYANGDKQSIQLEGILLRPFVHLNTSGIDQVEGPEVLDFGDVQEDKTIAIYLSTFIFSACLMEIAALKKSIKEKYSGTNYDFGGQGRNEENR
ncbi:unnamed protein product (macronuclear) [Paramecium tetraurelia]|uniref:Uncharacterized protein n=1 Tax=Paramecium tetraurelia TaxID=5888 RepID=A0CT12_PARTE|nr:uncharacterized protein GSPATT00038947001 [Paramecium tetraurelia]CAK73929.1 unnamed protein product [Paramecium tetraurelia]|eukprot:XP_001441326.1 hypothetical protein (macronuclear) [Paramecium tetraurelia strain d4-2]